MHWNGLIQSVFLGAALLINFAAPAISDSLPLIPSPTGFIESSSLVPSLRDQALLGHPARTRLIGVYLLPDELADIMRGAPQHMTIFCRAYINDEFASQDEAKAFFRRMIANAKQENSYKLDLASPTTRRIIQSYETATQERQGQSVKLTGSTILGSILETEDIFATAVIVSASAQTSQGQILIPLTGAVGWVRWRNQVLELSNTAQFTGSKSITATSNILLEWLNAFQSANGTP
ncbi:hypothetical protein [Bradyrhizobium sp. HKCCYLS20291]|uniref:hypothetical protein n=1 Tax=Bradyrhizobium sp. HKCCYLS20291 TaxID=3420766 RepID=UPI003EC09F1A